MSPFIQISTFSMCSLVCFIFFILFLFKKRKKNSEKKDDGGGTNTHTVSAFIHPIVIFCMLSNIYMLIWEWRNNHVYEYNASAWIFHLLFSRRIIKTIIYAFIWEGTKPAKCIVKKYLLCVLRYFVYNESNKGEKSLSYFNSNFIL